MDVELLSALAEARALGFLGPGPLEAHEASAQAFIDALGPIEGRALDLGSGGGVPGLLLARYYERVEWVLLDANRRRTSFLTRTVASLGWEDRVTVVRSQAEEAAHQAALRGTFAAVVSRSFGPPASTAECAAAFLQPGGRLAVAEPPAAPPTRWAPEGMGELGLSAVVQGRVAVFELRSPVESQFPRPLRQQQRRPLW